MNRQLKELAQKRQRLITQVASQRVLLAHNTDSWRKPLLLADKGLTVLRYIKHHPIVIAGGGGALLSIVKGNGITKWLKRGWVAWQLTKKIINK